MAEELSSTLPYDVMMEILSRLPVKSIVRFKSVSKSWLTVFTHPHFVKLHLARSSKFKIVLTPSPNYERGPCPKRSLYVLSFDRSGEASSFDDGDKPIDIFDHNHKAQLVRIVGSCRGLLLCYSLYSYSQYLVNPSTREVMRLQDSPFNPPSFAARGFGYDSSDEDYKVVQISNPYPGEIITSLYSHKSNSWSIIPDVPLLLCFSHPSGVFLNGNLHWHSQDGTKLISFSLSEEKFGYVPLPDNLIILYEKEALIGIVKGCLSYLFHRVNGIKCCWVMQEYGVKESWTKFEFYVETGFNFKSLDFTYNDENMFVIDNADFVMCNLQEETTCRFVDHPSSPYHNTLCLSGDGEAVACLECLESVVPPVLLV